MQKTELRTVAESTVGEPSGPLVVGNQEAHLILRLHHEDEKQRLQSTQIKQSKRCRLFVDLSLLRPMSCFV